MPGDVRPGSGRVREQDRAAVVHRERHLGVVGRLREPDLRRNRPWLGVHGRLRPGPAAVQRHAASELHHVRRVAGQWPLVRWPGVLRRGVHGRRLHDLHRARLLRRDDVRPPHQHLLRHARPAHADGDLRGGHDHELQRRPVAFPLPVFLRLPYRRQLLRPAEHVDLPGVGCLPTRPERRHLHPGNRPSDGAALQAERGVQERPALHRADVRLQFALPLLRTPEPISVQLHGRSDRRRRAVVPGLTAARARRPARPDRVAARSRCGGSSRGLRACRCRQRGRTPRSRRRTGVSGRRPSARGA